MKNHYDFSGTSSIHSLYLFLVTFLVTNSFYTFLYSDFLSFYVERCLLIEQIHFSYSDILKKVLIYAVIKDDKYPDLFFCDII